MTDQPTPPPADTQPAVTSQYKDDDFVYVDPENRTVVGIVQWSKNGNPKELEMPEPESPEEGSDAKGKGKRRPIRRKKRYYPWGTYRSMKAIYKLEGKPKREEAGKTLDEVLPKALEQAFWE